AEWLAARIAGEHARPRVTAEAAHLRRPLLRAHDEMAVVEQGKPDGRGHCGSVLAERDQERVLAALQAREIGLRAGLGGCLERGLVTIAVVEPVAGVREA